MFGNTNKIIEALATIKADTKNYKEDIQEIKESFEKHIDKEEKQSIRFAEKIDAIHDELQSFECPKHADIKKIERRVYDYQKQDEGRRVADIEVRAKEKILETKERAKKDEEIVKAISSLKTTRKYNYLSASGLYAILGLILKKLFVS